MAALFTGIVLCVSLAAQGPSPVPVTGRVVSGAAKQAVAGAVVSSGSNQASTDRNGAFTLLLPPGAARLTVEAAGAIPQQVAVTVAPGMAPLEILLVATSTFREQVTVQAAAEVSQEPSSIAISPASVLRVAGAADNIFKALHTMPGVNAVDDFGSRLSVRGGGPDQNLTVMDGIEIHNPYRLFGLTSAFNPETIDHFELTMGGFGAAYGDRLSSILLVANRPGTTKEVLAGSASLSLTDTNVVFEGRIPATATGSWLVSARRTYYDLIAERLVDSDLPSFTDVQLKAAWAPKAGHTLTFFGLRSREHTDLMIGGNDDADRLGDRAQNGVISVTYEAALTPRVASRTIVAWYRYMDDLDVNATFLNNAERSNTPNGVATASIIFRRDLTVHDRSLRQEVRIAAGSRHVLEAGMEFHLLRTAWGWTIAGDRNPVSSNGSSMVGGAGLPSLLRSARETTRAAGWFQDRIQVASRLRLEPGIRVDRSGVDGETIASPRLGARFDITPRTALRGAVGLFTQSPGYEKLLQSDYFVDLTDDTARQLASERSIHIVGALEHRLGGSSLARFETYVKTFDRLIVGRLETPAERAARVAQYNFPASLASSVPAAPQITTVPVNGASGRSFGFDVYVERRPPAANGRLSGWASYTWGRADIDAYGQQYPFDYDRRHTASVVGTIAAASRLDVSATFRVASGFAKTQPLGVRVAERPVPGRLPGTPGSLMPAVDDGGNLIWMLDFGDVSNLNRGRLPPYARLDVRVTFKPKTAAGRWLFYVEVLNVLNRENVTQFEPVLLFDPSSDRPAIDYASDSGLPRLPSFGFRFRF